ncbi:fatty acyl-AMP ligase, partial [Burkholderia pseudomallei]
FYPCYGLAEHTLYLTGGLESQPPVVANGQSDARLPRASDHPDAPGQADPAGDGPQARARAHVGGGNAASDRWVLIVEPD